MGESPWRQDGLLRAIGLCPAVDVLYPNVSALEWVRYLVELHGFDRREARQRAEHALQRVGMAAAMHRPMGTYSLGMRQRTKLAQAFAHDPSLLILDEPFNGLDPIGRHEMTEVLRKWVRDGTQPDPVQPHSARGRGGQSQFPADPRRARAGLRDRPRKSTPCWPTCRTRFTSAATNRRSWRGSSWNRDWWNRCGSSTTVRRFSWPPAHPLAVFEQLPAWLETAGRADPRDAFGRRFVAAAVLVADANASRRSVVMLARGSGGVSFRSPPDADVEPCRRLAAADAVSRLHRQRDEVLRRGPEKQPAIARTATARRSMQRRFGQPTQAFGGPCRRQAQARPMPTTEAADQPEERQPPSPLCARSGAPCSSV